MGESIDKKVIGYALSVVAKTLALILNGSGFEAVAFTEPLKALRAAAVKCPDFLITDVSMPLLNGIELGIQFKAIYPECRVLLFSGAISTAPLLEGAKQRGFEFTILAKPVHPTELLEALKRMERRQDNGDSADTNVGVRKSVRVLAPASFHLFPLLGAIVAEDPFCDVERQMQRNPKLIGIFGRIQHRRKGASSAFRSLLATLCPPVGGPVEQELLNIMSQLTNAGIRIDVLQPNFPTEVFVAELPNGKQYLFLRAGLLKLRDEGKLNIPGIEEFGVTR